MNLSEKSDYEINELVAKILNEYVEPPKGFDTECLGDHLHYIDENGSYCECFPDYCDNDELAFGIMIAYKIELSYPDNHANHWCADAAFMESRDFEGVTMAWNANPNRAICETFIMMSEGKDE